MRNLNFQYFFSVLFLLPFLGIAQASDCTNAIWPIPVSSVLTPNANCVNSAFSLTAAFSGGVGACVGATHPTCGWFSFTAACSSSNVAISAGTKNMAIVIWDNDCLFGPSQIACVNSNNMTPSLTFSTAAGTQYLIEVVRTVGGGGVATGNICVTNVVGTMTNNGSCTSLTNAGLEGCAGYSIAPVGWSTIAVGDAVCLASNPMYATPDLVDASSPLYADFLVTPQSGSVCVAGLHCGTAPNNFHEGIKQSVNGFTIGSTYTITFYQCVIRQGAAEDPTGSWQVFADNTLIGTSAISTSLLAVGNVNVVWNQRTMNFTATASTHVIKFLPKDNDANLTSWAVGEAAGVRMGLDNISINCLTSLPIELLEFGGIRNGNYANIFWSTATEINNDYFILERSIDGETWDFVTRIDGAGNSANRLDYDFKDKNLFYVQSYYRLKQFDFDWKISYSNLAPIQKLEQENFISIYPNPSSDFISIKSEKTLLDSEIQLYDYSGKLVLKKVVTNDLDPLTICIKDFAAGVYFVKVISSAFNATELFLKN